MSLTGFMVGTAVFGAKVRDYTPEKEVGLFQGVRMIFLVLIPMVTGPFIGRGVFYINPQYYLNDYGEKTILPNQFVFLFAGIVIALAVLPALYIILKERVKKQ